MREVDLNNFTSEEERTKLLDSLKEHLTSLSESYSEELDKDIKDGIDEIIKLVSSDVNEG
jgi:CHASE3 domain sensor protein